MRSLLVIVVNMPEYGADRGEGGGEEEGGQGQGQCYPEETLKHYKQFSRLRRRMSIKSKCIYKETHVL